MLIRRMLYRNCRYEEPWSGENLTVKLRISGTGWPVSVKYRRCLDSYMSLNKSLIEEEKRPTTVAKKLMDYCIDQERFYHNLRL